MEEDENDTDSSTDESEDGGRGSEPSSSSSSSVAVRTKSKWFMQGVFVVSSRVFELVCFLVRCFYYMFILTTDYRSTCLQRCIFAADGDWSQSLDTHQACLSRPGYAVSWNLGLLILVCNEIKQRGRYVFEKKMC